jgi:hypothetical protein
VKYSNPQANLASGQQLPGPVSRGTKPSIDIAHGKAMDKVAQGHSLMALCTCMVNFQVPISMTTSVPKPLMPLMRGSPAPRLLATFSSNPIPRPAFVASQHSPRNSHHACQRMHAYESNHGFFQTQNLPTPGNQPWKTPRMARYPLQEVSYIILQRFPQGGLLATTHGGHRETRPNLD